MRYICFVARVWVATRQPKILTFWGISAFLMRSHIFLSPTSCEEEEAYNLDLAKAYDHVFLEGALRKLGFDQK